MGLSKENFGREKQRMPGLEEGFHPAQSIVFGYRREAFEQILAIVDMIGNPIMSFGQDGDAFFNELALHMESTAAAIRKYLQAKEAGTRQQGRT